MLKEIRRVWVEDQYEPLDTGLRSGEYYFGRYKAGNYNVYLRRSLGQHSRLVQTVQLNQNWVWNPKTKKLSSRESNLTSALTIREHVLRGYFWNNTYIPKKICNLSKGTSVRHIKIKTGAECTLLIPKNAKDWILSLHGGPESYEGLEIRYGGLYRALVRKNLAIAILNYRGSSGLAHGISKKVWRNWGCSIQEDYLCLKEALKQTQLKSTPRSIFGVSFGGALALFLQKKFSIEKVVLSSPLLDLRNQIKRSTVSEKSWFAKRFGKSDLSDLSFRSLIQGNCLKNYIFYSMQDEVLGSEMFRKLELQKKSFWKMKRVSGGHVPKTYRQYCERYIGIYEALLK